MAPKRKMPTNVFETPLQRVVGFPVSEKTYDLLDFQEQLILDLLIEDWDLQDIAMEVGIKPRNMPQKLRIIRLKLAESELRYSLEVKRYYRANHPIVPDVPNLTDAGFDVLNLLEPR